MVSLTRGESELVGIRGRVAADAGVVGSWIGGDASEEGMVRMFAENNGEMFFAYSRVIICQCSKSDGVDESRFRSRPWVESQWCDQRKCYTARNVAVNRSRSI